MVALSKAYSKAYDMNVRSRTCVLETSSTNGWTCRMGWVPINLLLIGKDLMLSERLMNTLLSYFRT